MYLNKYQLPDTLIRISMSNGSRYRDINATIQRYDISVESRLCHRSLSFIIDRDNLS